MTGRPRSLRPVGTSTTLHVAGMALQFVAGSMVVCGVIALVDGRDAAALFSAAVIAGMLGALGHRGTRLGELDRADIFSAVGATWLLVSVVGTLPYLLAGTFDRPGIGLPVVLADALFESVSGYSCTGSTVFGAHNPIEAQGAGILFYRQLTQWLGGMGIVVLVVAVLPSLRASGLGLIGAEAPGTGTDRLAPKVIDTARQFWLLYFGLTVFVSVGLFLAGMGAFDAVSHALTTASTGGFSTRDGSIGHWDSVPVEAVLIAAMVLGGASFALHAASLARRRPTHFAHPEFRAYITVLGGGIVAVTALLVHDGLSLGRAIRAATFNVVTLGTSSGFGNTTGPGTDGDFVLWPGGTQVILLVLLVFGGCTGSTAGGVKIMRLQVGMADALRSLRSFRRPRGVFSVFHGRTVLPESLVERVAGFMVVYGMFVVLGTLALTALGAEPLTAATGAIGSLGNMGPTLGEAGPTASFTEAFSTPARLVLAALMVVGRLEIFPMVLMVVAPYRAVRRRR